MTRTFLVISCVLLLSAVGCNGDGADALGIGSACTSSDTCAENQTCLTGFKGGYCGSTGCKTNDDCPANAACVVYGGNNYCFRICTDKVQCNANRPADLQSNCSSSITFASGKKEGKACLPPSG